MIKSKKIDKANSFFKEWDGSDAEFNHFVDSMSNRFTIGVYKEGLEPTGISFSACQFIQGPTFWKNMRLRCSAVEYDGVDCFKVCDEAAGFKVIVGSGITGGGINFSVTVSE